MKKSKRIAAAVVGVVCALGITAFASSYDSSEDPLISLSYLTNIFKPEIKADYEKQISALEDRIKSLENGGQSTASGTDNIIATEGNLDMMFGDPALNTGDNKEPETTAPSSTYEVVELKTGDALYAVSACDIMLRAGSAVCIAPDPTQGLADYTSAVEIYNGMGLTKNHMCLIPRGDGRGIMATSESVFVMVRGDYTIVNAN